MKCCLCGKEIRDYGHNPWPLSDNVEDRCCDLCNMLKVIPARIIKSKEQVREGEENNGKC